MHTTHRAIFFHGEQVLIPGWCSESINLASERILDQWNHCVLEKVRLARCTSTSITYLGHKYCQSFMLHTVT